MILIVDDSRMNRMVLSKSLAQEGYDFIEAENADVALKMLDYRKPDLILLDVVMPEMSGFDLCRLLKQQESTRKSRLFLLPPWIVPKTRFADWNWALWILLPSPLIRLKFWPESARKSPLQKMYRTILKPISELRKIWIRRDKFNVICCATGNSHRAANRF